MVGPTLVSMPEPTLDPGLDHDRDVNLAVTGYLPPAKGEAKSMLSGGHAHAHRVGALLEKAREAMEGREPLSGPIALTVTVRAPAGMCLSDATNFLGGIGDVLQLRETGADVTHLGPLAAIGCYHDDKQIEEIHYRQRTADAVGYEVHLRKL